MAVNKQSCWSRLPFKSSRSRTDLPLLCRVMRSRCWLETAPPGFLAQPYNDPWGPSHLLWPLERAPSPRRGFFGVLDCGGAWTAFLEMNEQVKAKLGPKAPEQLGGNTPHSSQTPTPAARRSGGAEGQDTRDLSTDWSLL